MLDHAARAVPLPVQDAVADVIRHVHGNQGELLQHGHAGRQAPQLPVRLHSDESGTTTLLLHTHTQFTFIHLVGVYNLSYKGLKI